MTDEALDLGPGLTSPDPDEMLRTAYLSDDGVYRYALTRVWGDTRSILTWIMLNPSTADALVDDPTIRRCIGFAREWGHGGIEVLNLYAYRSTDPKGLWADGVEPTGGKRNNHLLGDALSMAAHRRQPVIAAWGANAKVDRVAWLLSRPNAHVLHHLGLTKAGQPKHPLYLPKTARPERLAA